MMEGRLTTKARSSLATKGTKDTKDSEESLRERARNDLRAAKRTAKSISLLCFLFGHLAGTLNDL